MTDMLFTPNKIRLPHRLVLVPRFFHSGLFRRLEKRAGRSLDLLGSRVLVLEHFGLVTGFLGYSHLLTLLEFIEGIREKEIYFLGTAGSLETKRYRPCSLNVTSVAASGLFTYLNSHQTLTLRDFEPGDFEKVRGVSVDLVQRETREWLRRQVREGNQVVEMELFPLGVYLDKPFVALVVLSDRVDPEGIKPFRDRRGLKREFGRAFQAIETRISGNRVPRIHPD